MAPGRSSAEERLTTRPTVCYMAIVKYTIFIITLKAAGILGDKLSYLPGEGGEPIYERRADMRELLARQALTRGQEVRQVRG